MTIRAGGQRQVDVLVEIPLGSRNKYVYDHERGVIGLDRVLSSSIHYPVDYGFIPETLAEDGEPLDVMILTYEPTFPGCLVRVRPIGLLDLRDEKGRDLKVLAVPTRDPRFDQVSTLRDLPDHWLREIETFFRTYKALEDKSTEIRGWDEVGTAWTAIEAGRAAQREARGAG